MSAIADDHPAPAPAGSPGTPRQHPDLEHGVPVCPFLRSRDGSWSSTHASAELRCWAVRPPAQPSPQKQRELCLVASHAACMTYEAAVAADSGLVAGDVSGMTLWPAASPVPVALESVGSRGVGIASPRAGGQALLVMLMIAAFVVLVIARAAPLGGAVASPPPAATELPGASSAVGGSALPSPVPTVEPSPSTVAPTASPTATPTPAPTASPRTYKVKSGDTIAGIAAKYHTTVKAIVVANNIVDARTIHPGQILIIP